MGFWKKFDLQYHFLGFKNFKCRFFAVFRLNVPKKSSFLFITSAKMNIILKNSVIVLKILCATMSCIFWFSILMVWQVIKIETRSGFPIIYRVMMVVKFGSLNLIIEEGYAVAYNQYKFHSTLHSIFFGQFKISFENIADDVLPP